MGFDAIGTSCFARKESGVSRIRLKLNVDVEGEDVSEETLQHVEISVAQWIEQLEARLIQHVERNCPQVKFISGASDGEEWKQ